MKRFPKVLTWRELPAWRKAGEVGLVFHVGLWGLFAAWMLRLPMRVWPVPASDEEWLFLLPACVVPGIWIVRYANPSASAYESAWQGAKAGLVAAGLNTFVIPTLYWLIWGRRVPAFFTFEMLLVMIVLVLLCLVQLPATVCLSALVAGTTVGLRRALGWRMDHTSAPMPADNGSGENRAETGRPGSRCASLPRFFLRRR